MVLTSPPDGALLARRRPTFAGSADPADPVKVVVRRGGDTVATLTATPGSGGRWSAAPADPLADGSYAARARQGGRSSAAHDFTIDATAPKVAIAHPADGATTDLMAFDGKAGQGGPVRVRLDGVDVASQRNGGRWTALARPVGPGSHTVTATQRDAAGNVGRAAATFTAPVNLLAAGDIAACDSTGDEATAAVVAQRSGTIAALGDNAYDSPGAPDPYPDCFEPSWGALRPRIMPTPGNHEYEDSFGAADYFAYFGAAAGSPDKGYYSYDLGSWHVIVLNTNDDCSPSQVSCSAVSAQVTWLRTDLAAHAAARCTLAYFHHPRFSSYLGEDAKVGPLWDALYQGGADLVLNGHAHNYERYAPQDPDGAVDPARGLTEIVAGTGGRSHHSFFPTVDANSVVRDDDTYGILDVRLQPAGWSWRFLPAAGGSFTDGGSADCH
jgi:alkaline phosphatase